MLNRLILDLSILSGLPGQIASDLFASATQRRLKLGDTLFEAGDPGDGCYRLDEGALKVSLTSPEGDERILAILAPGALVGELAILDGLPRSASVVALRDCKLRFISRVAFEDCTRRHPQIYRHLVVLMAARLREANDTIGALAFLTIKGRVARALMEIADSFGEDAGSRATLIRFKINQRDLAAMAGVARENASRILNEWERGKLVTKSSGYYCIDKARLEREIYR